MNFYEDSLHISNINAPSLSIFKYCQTNSEKQYFYSSFSFYSNSQNHPLNLSSCLSNHSVYSIETVTVEGRIELNRSLLTVISRVIDYFYTVIGYLCKNLVERWDISTMFRGISQNYPQRNYGGRGSTYTAERDRRLSNRKYEKHMVPR